MSYCIQTDLYNQISQAELIQLTDDSGAGVVDADKVSQAISDADAEIDAYLASRYSVPLDTVPAIIGKLSVDMAIYHLCSRRSAGMPDVRKERYNLATGILEGIASGKISIGVSSPAPSTDSGPKTTTYKSDRLLTIGKTSDGSIGTLDGY